MMKADIMSIKADSFVVVVETRAPELWTIECETQGTYEVQRSVGSRTQPRDVARVGRDLWLDEGYRERHASLSSLTSFSRQRSTPFSRSSFFQIGTRFLV